MTDIPIIFVTHNARSILTRLNADRLINDTTKLLIVTHFYITRDREILAERISNKTVIGENSAQIRVSREQDAEKVEGLALKPIRARPDFAKRSQHRERLILSKNLKPETIIILDRQQMNRCGKTPALVLSGITGVIYTSQIDELLEVESGIIPKLSGNSQIISCRNNDCNLTTGIHHPLGALSELFSHQLSQKL